MKIKITEVKLRADSGYDVKYEVAGVKSRFAHVMYYSDASDVKKRIIIAVVRRIESFGWDELISAGIDKILSDSDLGIYKFMLTKNQVLSHRGENPIEVVRRINNQIDEIPIIDSDEIIATICEVCTKRASVIKNFYNEVIKESQTKLDSLKEGN